MVRLFFILVVLFSILACSKKPKDLFENYAPPPVVDYSNPNHWAALPTKLDSADLVPHPSMQDRQATAEVDVFFLHPTTYTRTRGNDQWNGPINDRELNLKTDRGTIRNQASIFNGVGRVFAPRYRQAHLYAYYSKDTVSAKKAFVLAYKDVRAAFEFYLKNYNQGRPIIIASHSQGTTHAGQLLADFFDGKPLQQQLVAAYLVGMPVLKNQFKNIKVCETPEETGCFCTWRTYKKNYFPKRHQPNNNIAVTNPLTWTTTDEYANKKLNEGSVMRNFSKSYYTNLVDAQVHDGLLWANKPKFPGSFLITFKNYHIADFNFYYANVRKNAQLRAKVFLEK